MCIEHEYSLKLSLANNRQFCAIAISAQKRHKFWEKNVAAKFWLQQSQKKLGEILYVLIITAA